MLFIVHLDPALRIAASTVGRVELAVATIQNVYFRVGQLWVAMDICFTILFAEEASPGEVSILLSLFVVDDLHAWCTVRGEFAVQYDESSSGV